MKLETLSMTVVGRNTVVALGAMILTSKRWRGACPELRTEIEILPLPREKPLCSGHEDLAPICHSMWDSRLRVGFPMPDLGEPVLESCYSAFRKHCVEIHGLRQDNVADSSMHLDLEKWTLTLLK